MVVTGATRNRFALLEQGTWVRIPPSPPFESVLFNLDIYLCGEMSEGPKERDWKSRVPLKGGTEGSNPSLSAIFYFIFFYYKE